MKILLIEDDKKTASFIIDGLKRENFISDHATNGEDGLHLAMIGGYDAAIVDVMLPKLDGFTLIARMRDAGIFTPVIVLSARSSLDDRLLGFKNGADDYLVKPFSFSELLARLHAIIKRSSTSSEDKELAEGDLVVDLIKRRVRRGDVEIDLQPKEFVLLEYLMRNKGRVVSKTMIVEHVWNYDFDPQTNVVETRICRLRDKVDRPFTDNLIHTIRGVGYVFESKK